MTGTAEDVSVDLTGPPGRQGRDHHAAEDLVQDVLARVHLAWHRVGDPDACARRALVNATTPRWRARARRPEVRLDEHALLVDPGRGVDGAPARSGSVVPVRVGEAVEIAGVAPAGDGSSARVTVPASAGPGPARLSVQDGAWEQQPGPGSTGRLRLDYGADLDVPASETSPEGSS